MVDDGHGMSREEFERRWLVVGTESKVAQHRTTLADRNGLKLRLRQGQKGIGRLSCANLGPLLLLVSKRIRQPLRRRLDGLASVPKSLSSTSPTYVMPVIEFDRPERLFDLLPDLADSLASNVSAEDDSDRSDRIRSAWAEVDREIDSDDHDVGAERRRNSHRYRTHLLHTGTSGPVAAVDRGIRSRHGLAHFRIELRSSRAGRQLSRRHGGRGRA